MSEVKKPFWPNFRKVNAEAGKPLTDEQIAAILSPHREHTPEEFKRLYSCSWDVAKPGEDKSVIPVGAFVMLNVGGPYRVIRSYEHKGRHKYRVAHLNTGSERGVRASEVYAVLSEKQAKEYGEKSKRQIEIENFI